MESREGKGSRVHYFYPLRLETFLRKIIWGGRRLERDGLKQFAAGDDAIGEAWETEIHRVVLNGPYAGKKLGELVEELGTGLLGELAVAIFGQRFPLLAKFIDANARLSVQVHPDDSYAARHEGGSLGKTEFWYILAADPGASIVHGFKEPTSREEVEKAIQDVTLEKLLHNEPVQAGDVIFVPAGTVHAIGEGVLLYELQEYSDVTYRMYDYGRKDDKGQLRELHIERSLDVSNYSVSPHIKMTPVTINETPNSVEHCLIACQYFVTSKLEIRAQGKVEAETGESCLILSALAGEMRVKYGPNLELSEVLKRGETIVLPAELGQYTLTGEGVLLRSYVPSSDDTTWAAWQAANS